MKEEEIDYKKLVHDLNWVSNPHRPVPPEVVKVSPKILFISNSLFVFIENHVFFVLFFSPIFPLVYGKGPSINGVSPNFRFLGYPPFPCLLKSTAHS